MSQDESLTAVVTCGGSSEHPRRGQRGRPGGGSQEGDYHGGPEHWIISGEEEEEGHPILPDDDSEECRGEESV